MADRLTADAYFSNVPVITEEISDIENAIQQAIAKLGVCVIVVTPTASASFPDTLKPYFDNIKIICRVVENVVLNRSTRGTNKPASDVAEMVSVLLHNYAPTGVSENIFLDNPSITIANTGGVGKLLSYDVRLKTQGGFDFVLDTVATPVIAIADDSMALSCATPGAAIFYTLDGSSPTPGNPTALVWSGYQTFGTYALPQGVNSGTLTGLGLPFNPAVVVMTVSSPAGGLTLHADESGGMTGDGWPFNMNGYTDSDQYILHWSAYSSGAMVPAQVGAHIRARGWLCGMLTSAESSHTVTGTEGLNFPLIPAVISGGQMTPTVDDSGSVISWPFRDQVTGSIVYVRIVDGAFQFSNS